MKFKKVLALLVGVSCIASTFSGCTMKYPLKYYSQMPVTSQQTAQRQEAMSNSTYGGMPYNTDLFYRNDLKTECADPDVIYISDRNNRDYGYYYMYATSDMSASCYGFSCWRSKDLENWELVGQAFDPDKNSWGTSGYWAPEVKYDQSTGKYLLYYSAVYTTGGYNPAGTAAKKSYDGREEIGLAIADNPWGPFTQYVPAGGSIDMSAFLDPDQLNASLKTNDPDYATRDIPFMCIDVDPFEDPATGKKYLYFKRDGITTGTDAIFGIEMKDWYTPDYSTLTQLTKSYQYTLTDTSKKVPYEAGIINEGPFMIEHDGKYYLTFSVNGYMKYGYAVAQAIGNSPLGSFRKLTPEEGGLLLSDQGEQLDDVACPGHHCFIQAGNELMMVYHERANRSTDGAARAVAVDRVKWVKNNEGETVLYLDGPTWSLQPKINSDSEYHNIAQDAILTASNMKGNNAAQLKSLQALNDGLLAIDPELTFIPEFQANAGTTTITLRFKTFRDIRAIMIYNSVNYDETFKKIDRVEIDFRRPDKKGAVSTAYATNIPFDWGFYLNQMTKNTMRPGGSSILEFNEMEADQIRITISGNPGKGVNRKNYTLAVSEIVVLGK